jgi:ABC-2 type transport system ATP-binding protein
MNSDFVIEVINISKRYNEVTVLDNVNINVPYGQIFGLLGPNGSGKTTLIKILSTLIRPHGGVAYVCGYDVVKQASQVHQKITVVSQNHGMDIFLSGYDNLIFFAEIYGVPRHQRRKRVDECLAMMGLMDARRRPTMYYSGGMQRRLALARSLLAPSTVLILDEPTKSLDPEIKKSFWGYVTRANKENGTVVFVATHDVGEVEDYCHALAILRGGKVIAQGSLQELKSRIRATDVIHVELPDVGNEALDALRALPEVIDVKLLPSPEAKTQEREKMSELRVYVEEYRRVLPSIISSLLAKGVHINTITIRRPSLQDLYLQYLRKEAG